MQRSNLVGALQIITKFKSELLARSEARERMALRYALITEIRAVVVRRWRFVNVAPPGTIFSRMIMMVASRILS